MGLLTSCFVWSLLLHSPSFVFLSFAQIFWSDSGELVCIATEESFFILRYMAEKVAASHENNEGVTEDGIEDAFEVGVWMYARPLLGVYFIEKQIYKS